MGMTLTPFGIAIRKARIDLDLSLKDMAEAANVSSSFLSAIENGRKLLNDSLYTAIEQWLASKKFTVPDMRVLADISNQKVSLKGLSATQAMLVSRLAHARLSKDLTSQLKALLAGAKVRPAAPAEEAKDRTVELGM